LLSGLMASVQAQSLTAPYLQVETGTHAAFIRRIDVSEAQGVTVTVSDDKTARVWTTASGELKLVLRPPVAEGEIGRLYGVAIHPRQDLVAVGGTTGKGVGQHRILLFSLSTGQLVTTFDARGGDIKKLAWTRDGSLLLAVYAGDNALRAFDSSGVLAYEQALTAPAYGLAVSSDGQAAASSLDGRIVVVSARIGKVEPIQTFKTSTDQAVGLSFSPDSTKIVVGFRKPNTFPEVLDVSNGRSLFKLQQHGIVEGTQLSVAWSQDGRQIVAAGSGYHKNKRFPIYFHDAATGRIAFAQEVAADTVFDLVALPQGKVAWASHDGTWGILDQGDNEVAIKSPVADLKGPGTLLVSQDGRRVGFTYAWGSEPATFDFSRRSVTTGADTQLEAPNTNRTDRSAWENSLTAKVNGRAIELDPDEVSRALDYFPSGGDAALGTSFRLLRIGQRGEVKWQTRTSGEVRSVNVTPDGRMVVSGMSDGTLRWWRATDGTPLLALLAARDGRWVAWTPDGYYDAAAAADRLVGWTVNRADGMGADHFSLGRFREHFNRPDLIDKVLDSVTTVDVLDPTTRSIAMQFPPVLDAINLAAMKPTPGEMQIPVAVRAEGQVKLEVRVDGRPVPSSAQTLPHASPSEIPATQTTIASIPTPAEGSIVQVIATDSHGVSEPLQFKVEPVLAQPAGAALFPVTAVEQPVVTRSRIQSKAQSTTRSSTAPPSIPR